MRDCQPKHGSVKTMEKRNAENSLAINKRLSTIRREADMAASFFPFSFCCGVVDFLQIPADGSFLTLFCMVRLDVQLFIMLFNSCSSQA